MTFGFILRFNTISPVPHVLINIVLQGTSDKYLVLANYDARVAIGILRVVLSDAQNALQQKLPSIDAIGHHVARPGHVGSRLLISVDAHSFDIQTFINSAKREFNVNINRIDSKDPVYISLINARGGGGSESKSTRLMQRVILLEIPRHEAYTLMDRKF